MYTKYSTRGAQLRGKKKKEQEKYVDFSICFLYYLDTDQ